MPLEILQTVAHRLEDKEWRVRGAAARALGKPVGPATRDPPSRGAPLRA